jgi:excinuclease ABC subunit A
MQIFKNLFANLHESKIRGYSTVKFGTDKPGGRCEICKGNGSLFDPSGYEESLCPICLGKRYRDEILEIRYKLMSIADILDLSVSRAMEIFADFESLISKLKPLADTGLHYLRLGQPTTHLSGGELQRLRLAQDLAKAKLPRTLYLFDEPARGLSLKDTTLLLNLLKGLTQKGHTVIAIEHNEMFRSHANYILELGPGAGEEGGYIVNA